MAAIDDKIEELEKSGNYSRIYGNRALKTVGLYGNQRPDIIAFRNDGVIEIYEYASESQKGGKRLKDLQAKLDLMAERHGATGVFYGWNEY